MNQRRSYRWMLFFVAVVCFFYVTFFRASWWAIVLFFISGLLWFWLERRKTRELDWQNRR